MTPALTLTFTAQGLQVASADIGQQMRLADVLIEQTSAAQRALVAPYYVPPQAKAKPAVKAENIMASLIGSRRRLAKLRT